MKHNPIVMAFVVCCISLPSVLASESIIISQVYYDPTDESGGEAVELYNPAAFAVNISGWIISTEISSTDATIPDNTVIDSENYYLLADAGWSTSRDDLSWPLADHEEAITLTNTDAGVAVSNATHMIDAVGWGDPLNILAGLYEGTPHPGTGPGQVLVRTADTDNNVDDYIATDPNFRNSSYGDDISADASIGIIVIVEGAAPEVHDIIITDEDPFSGGIQIVPVPKSNKSVAVTAIISDPSGEGDVISVTAGVGASSYQLSKTQMLNATAAEFTGEFNLSYTVSPGLHTVTITAADNADLSVQKILEFDYQSLVAFTIDTDAISFNGLPGQSPEIAGDRDIGSSNITIWNTGNSPVDFGIQGSDLATASELITVDNLRYTFGNPVMFSDIMSKVSAVHDTNLLSDGKLPLSFKLDIPLAASPGTYHGDVYLTAVVS